MSERKTIHRVFWEWDFEKEERWLNEMAMNGWALEKAYFATYIFAPCEPGEYIFRMEMNSNKDYRSFVEGLPSSICCVPHCCPMALDASTARRKAWKVSAFCTNDFVKPFCATTA